MAWQKLGFRELSVLFDSMVCIANRDRTKQVLGIDFSFKRRMYISKYLHMDDDELEKFYNITKQRCEEDKQFLFRVASECFEQCETLVMKARHISELSRLEEGLESYSKSMNLTHDKSRHLQKLKARFEEYTDELLKQLVYLFAFPYGLEKIAEQRLRELLETKVASEKAKAYYLNILSTPSKESDSIKEERGLLKIAVKIQRNKEWQRQLLRMPFDKLGEIRPIASDKAMDKELYALISEHIHRFAWINFRHFLGKPWDEAYFISRLRNMIREGEDCAEKLRKLNNKPIEDQLLFEKAVKLLKIKDEMLRLINLFREYVYMRTLRKDAMVRSGYCVKGLFEKIAAELGMSYREFVSLSYDEILFMLDKKIEAEKRCIHFSSSFVDGVYTCYSGSITSEEIGAIASNGTHELNHANLKDIKGLTANRGKARGRAKIIIGKADLHKIELGDIMITPLSTPDFVAAIEKCSAIVTDEGGITCHAAIVSRELNKPCIIGTKFATKVFKDGDIVEVDADKGIVRKI